jgi:cell division protease FtsH
LNTKKNNTYKGFIGYAAVVISVIAIWYLVTGNTTTNSYTKSEFVQALSDSEVTSVTVTQNREIPTGSLNVVYADGSRHVL